MSVVVNNKGAFIGKNVILIGSGVVTLDKGSEIREFTVIEMLNGRLTLGQNTVIGYHSFFQCTGDLIIGNGSLLGPHVVCVTSSHPVNDQPLVGQPLIRGEITIGDNVWIGANVTVGYNTSIGSNAIVAANSFVNKEIPPNEIWGGVPAKKIRNR